MSFRAKPRNLSRRLAVAAPFTKPGLALSRVAPRQPAFKTRFCDSSLRSERRPSRWQYVTGPIPQDLILSARMSFRAKPRNLSRRLAVAAPFTKPGLALSRVAPRQPAFKTRFCDSSLRSEWRPSRWQYVTGPIPRRLTANVSGPDTIRNMAPPTWPVPTENPDGTILMTTSSIFVEAC